MMLFSVLLLSLVGLIHSEDKFIDKLPKCALKDEECLRDLYEKMVQTIGDKGIPELAIPPFDPIELKNVTISVMGLFDITLLKGVATGAKTCVFDKFTLDLVNGSGYQETTCSMKIEGKYELSSNNPLIKNFLGTSSVYGIGNGKASIDKVHITYDYPIYAQKRSDGEIYMKCDYKRIIYNYEVLGGAKFFADDIHLGNAEVSNYIIPLLNENWKYVMSEFGKPFIDKAMEFTFDFVGRFFDVVPARYFILDDLTPFARP